MATASKRKPVELIAELPSSAPALPFETPQYAIAIGVFFLSLLPSLRFPPRHWVYEDAGVVETLQKNLPWVAGETVFRPLFRTLVAPLVSNPFFCRFAAWSTGLAVAFCLLTWIQRAGLARGEKWLWPLLGAALFLFHPLNVEIKSQLGGLSQTLPLLLLAGAWLTREKRWRGLLLALAPGFHELGLLYLAGFALTLLPAKRFREASALGALLAGWAIYFAYGGAGEIIAPTLYSNPLVAQSFGTALLSRVALLGHGIGLILYPLGLSSDYSAGTLTLPPAVFSVDFLLGSVALGLLARATNQLRRTEWGQLILVITLSSLLINGHALFLGTRAFTEMSWWPTWFALCLGGFAYLNTREWDGAKITATFVPLCLAALFFFCLNYERQAEWISSDELFKADMATYPKNGRLPYNYGFALAQLGAWEGAKAGFEKSAALYPDFAEAHYRLSLVLKNLGETEKAAQQSELASKLGLKIP